MSGERQRLAIWLAAVTVGLGLVGCRKEERARSVAAKTALAPSLLDAGAGPPVDAALRVPAALPVPVTSPVPAPSNAEDQPPDDDGPGGEEEPIAPGKKSERLARLLASPGHRKLVLLARAMLGDLEKGKCEESLAKAPDLQAAVRTLVGDIGDSLERALRAVEAIKAGNAQELRQEEELLDVPFTTYKTRLQGVAVTVSVAARTVRLLSSVPDARRRTCDNVQRALREIQQK